MPIDKWVKRSVPVWRGKTKSRTYRKNTSRRRRSYGRTRYRKRRGGMSNKRILNLTSRKKRDTMLTITNNQAGFPNGNQPVYTNGPAVISGGSGRAQFFLFCATAREFSSSIGGAASIVSDVASRTATSCYMRGLSEKIEIQIGDGLPWQWRRICFTAKGLQRELVLDGGFDLLKETSRGYSRLLNQVTGDNELAMQSILFKGEIAVDWDDPLTAQVDRSRVTVKYDKTITISSGNDDGVIRKYSRWHGMNHNLQYNDEENGGTETSEPYSVLSKAGMGDYYVVDLFRPRNGSNGDNRLSLSMQSSLYWHEK